LAVFDITLFRVAGFCLSAPLSASGREVTGAVTCMLFIVIRLSLSVVPAPTPCLPVAHVRSAACTKLGIKFDIASKSPRLLSVRDKQ
jgi:hypothetical protein